MPFEIFHKLIWFSILLGLSNANSHCTALGHLLYDISTGPRRIFNIQQAASYLSYQHVCYRFWSEPTGKKNIFFFSWLYENCYFLETCIPSEFMKASLTVFLHPLLRSLYVKILVKSIPCCIVQCLLSAMGGCLCVDC